MTPQEILRAARTAYDNDASVDLITAIHNVSPNSLLAGQAMWQLLAHLSHLDQADPTRSLAKWEKIRTRSEVMREMARAAEDPDAIRELDDRHIAEMAETERVLRQRLGEGSERGVRDE